MTIDDSFIQLLDGSIWRVNFTEVFEVANWFLGDDITVVMPTAAVPSWRLVNDDRCEEVLVTPI